jgi:Leucine-rich repeat (LRR) protein
MKNIYILSLAVCLLGITGNAIGQFSVVWTDLVGMTVSGNTLTKTGAVAWGNGGAASVNRLPISTDGWLEFRAIGNTNSQLVGFSSNNPDAHYNTIEYAVHLQSGIINVLEKGVNRGNMGTYTNDDVFRVERVNGIVKYYRNNSLLYTSTVVTNSELLVDVAYLETGASLYDFRASFDVPQGQPATALVIDKQGEAATISWTNGSGTGRVVVIRADNPIEIAPVDGIGYTASSAYGTGGLIGTDEYVVYNGIGNSVTITGLEPLRKYYVGVFEYTGTGISTIYNEVSFPQKSMTGYSVVWTDLVGMAISADTLIKTGTVAWGNGGAASVNRLPISTDGWLEFKAIGNTNSQLVGFSSNSPDAHYNTIEYAVHLQSGIINVLETGVNRGNMGTYTNDDVFRVERVNGIVKYYRNNSLLYTSTVVTNSELLVDVAYLETGASLYDFKSSFANPAQGIVSDIAEIAALRNLYESTNGATWTNNTGWPTTPAAWDALTSVDQIVGWNGVTTLNGDVTQIDLNTNNLTGAIPSSIGNLSELTLIYLYSNNLSGLIPSELGNLSSLRRLYLYYNNLNGSLPSELGNLSLLHHLLLQNNALNGTIPSTFGNLLSLTSLNLSDNQLFGTLPASLGNLTNLSGLKIGNNQLSGSIPSSLENLTQLLHLHLYSNNLIGSIPMELLNLSTLSQLYLNGNNFTSFPDFTSYLTSVNINVRIQNNYIPQADIDASLGIFATYTHTPQKTPNGTVGDEIELQVLRDLYESTNGATWTNSTGWPTTPAEWDAVTSIDQVVGWYGITTVGGDVTHISLVNNNLSGVIPPTLGNLTSLIYLYLDNNNLSGSIPSSLGNLSSLVRLYLHANSLIGSIPAELGNLSSLSQLFLHNNVLTDSIPANLGNMSALTNMSLSGNNLSGAIPSTLGNLTNLTSLQLTGNQLSGAIPPTLGNLTSLIYLYLDNNNLSGSIPSSLGNLSSLTRLYLHANSLIGSIPAELGNLSSLSQLFLHNNVLTDSIPANLGNMSALTNMSLSGNNLSGAIPSTLGNLTNLTSLQLSGNQLTGVIPSTLGNLTSLIYLYLDNNNLSGSIPSSLGNLSSLVRLYLHANSLIGSIPATLRNITTLRQLYLHNNALQSFPDWNGYIHASAMAVSINNNYIPQADIDANLGIFASYIYSLQKTPNGIIGDEIELQALRDLYNSTNGGTWTNNTGWPTTAAEWDAIISVDQIVGWNGIVIANGDITEIRLTGNGLTGSIPNSIGNFLALKKLYLNGNALTGAIPTEIGALTLLENLMLNGNQLTGAIPTTIGDLSNLKYLYLAANQLTGNIPESFGNLNTVLQLWLHNNLLEGSIPTTLTNPEIRLNNNNLTGSIPAAFLNNSTLHTLLLNDNSLTGVPDFTAHANAVNLNIDVSNNYLLLADIEQNLKSPDSYPFQTFTYAPQLSPANTVNITMNSDKYIAADRNSVSHPHYQWQKWNGTTWVNEGINDDHHQPDFSTLTIGDKFRCEMTSIWVTGVTNYSSEFVVTEKLNDSPTDFEFKGLYNGNITSMKWRTAAPENIDGEGYTGIYLFDYDNKYQLKEAAWGVDNGPLGITRGTNKFKLKGLTYDANGNIKTLQRYDQYNESSHNFTYDYNLRDASAPKTNQLEMIDGYASYHYNRIGQLIEEIDETGAGMHKYIDYDVTGKVVAVYSDATKNEASKKVSYIYDDRGFRLMSKNHKTKLETWYIRDASGNVMSIYEKKPDVALVQTEVPVYGSGKVGVYYPQQDGSTAYELTDHLGNVRAVVKNSVTTFTATMEDNGLADYTNPRVEEMQYFENLFTTTKANVYLGLNHTGTDVVADPDNATYLTGSPVATTGPTILLKVRTGDGVDARVFGKYKVETSYIEPVNLTSALNNLILNAAGELTLVSAASQIDALYAAAIAAGTQTTTLPTAGLKLIYFNSDFISTTTQTDPLQSGAGFTTDAEAAAISLRPKCIGRITTLSREGQTRPMRTSRRVPPQKKVKRVLVSIIEVDTKGSLQKKTVRQDGIVFS